jgi:hypothetical protein
MTRRRRVESILVLCLVGAGVTLWNDGQKLAVPPPATCEQHTVSGLSTSTWVTATERTPGSSRQWLSFGDLPGYTGWPRPSDSTAAWYNGRLPSSPAKARQVFRIQLACRHDTNQECWRLEALWDVRAYGPAILPGRVTSFHNGSYAVDFLFHDPGVYVVEVVLAFSNVAPLASFPSIHEPAYEGYLVPGFPTTVVVQPSLNPPPANDDEAIHPARTCGSDDLLQVDDTSILQRARWKVSRRTRGQGNLPQTNSSYWDYKHGLASIGFTADYIHQDCHLPTVSQLQAAARRMADPSHHVIVLIGDSHMRKQHKLFLEHFGDIFTSVYLKTNDGLLVRLPEIRASLQDVKLAAQADATKTHFYTLFNAGLHEVAILCTQRRVGSRGRVISTPDETFSCTEQYRRNLLDLVAVVEEEIPATTSKLRVFQSTSAGWLKWGNYGFAWEPNRTQEYPLASQACADVNTIAWEVMDQYRIPVLDSYWLTVARPDHREIDPLNARGKKMVHAGVEVYDVLLRQWMTMVLASAGAAVVSY